MNVSKYAILKHLSFMIFLTAILTVAISYPFLRGDYDQLAIPISTPHKKGYNLSFEQPGFLLDRLGTREWVVYNPLDENSVYSHTAWLLTTEQPELSQGWYASGSTGHQHWKYFLFD